MSTDPSASTPDRTGRPPVALIGLAWVWVAAPFLYGLIALLLKIPALFSGG